MKGYKATDANMQCRGFQFELNKWYEHEGELVECASGFHFCEHPSGVWAYYSEPGTRVFEIEAEDVLAKSPEPGADVKRVARRIRFLKEITPDASGSRNTGNYNTGNYNTGNYNTGNYNTGHRNTGHCNTGHCNTGSGNTGDNNTGHYNTGSRNTGSRNTGDYNIGNRNTGNCNTGNYNTGNCNTGNYNTGNYNTGTRNTGNRNTGDGNATSYCAGFFCVEEPKVICFDTQTDMTRDEFTEKHPNYWRLCELLTQQDEIDFERFADLPGITREKLKALHEKHLAIRSHQ